MKYDEAGGDVAADAFADTPALRLMAAVLETAVDDSIGRARSVNNRTLAQQRAQYWLFEDPRGLDRFGSLAFVCAQLNIDHLEFRERWRRRFAEHLLPPDQRRMQRGKRGRPRRNPTQRPPRVRSAASVAKMKATIAERRARGERWGRPRKQWPAIRSCEVCAARFDHLRGDGRRVCSPACSRALALRARRKLPPDAFVAWLYEAGFSLTAIARKFDCESHKAASAALERVGVARRARRRPVATSCCEPDCQAPVYKIRHATLGVDYGTRCKAHWDRHRAALAARYAERKRGNG